jgi:hypothetical protein
MKERWADLGYEPIASSADAFARQIRSDIEVWGKVIRAADIKVRRAGEKTPPDRAFQERIAAFAIADGVSFPMSLCRLDAPLRFDQTRARSDQRQSPNARPS